MRNGTEFSRAVRARSFFSSVGEAVEQSRAPLSQVRGESAEPCAPSETLTAYGLESVLPERTFICMYNMQFSSGTFAVMELLW